MSRPSFRRSSRRAPQAVRRSRAIMDALESRTLMHGGDLQDVVNLPLTTSGENLPALESTTPTGTGPDTGISVTGTVGLSGLQKHHSRPGAAVKLYLDFDGYAGSVWGKYTVPAQTAWSTDGDASTFNTFEQQAIYEVWARVAEKYSPFNIDVTTEDPGNRNPYQTLAMVFCSDDGSSWLGAQAGGIAYINSFRGVTGGNTGFVLPKNMGFSARYSAEAAAHESGHAFGLSHQSIWSGGTKTSEYNSGNSLVAPIMGSSYTAERGLWSYGTTTSATTYQDDLAILTSSANGFGYAADDHTNAVSGGTALTVNGTSVSRHGVIEQMNDSDVFSFTTGAGWVQLTVNSAMFGAMLDLKLSLYDAGGRVVASANNQTFGETLNVSLGAGTYKLAVASNGGYGDLGQYSITGTVAPVVVAPQVPAAPTGVYAVATAASAITVTWNDVSGETGYVVQRSTDGTNFGTHATLGAGATSYVDVNLPAGKTFSYRIVATNLAGNSPASSTVSASTAAAVVRVPGDANRDGIVNSFDLNIVAGNWLSTSASWGTGDFNGDSKVDSFDLNILASNWLQGTAAASTTADAAAADAVVTEDRFDLTTVQTSKTRHLRKVK